MLEKDKNCIEFSMHSMMATHKPYQEDTEIAITGMAPGKSLLLANNPFDIPCDVVVVSKRYFERLQTENEQLKKKLEEFSPVPGYREFLKALYPEATEATIEKLVWTTGQLCCGRDLPNALQTDLEYYRALSSSQAKSVYNWKEATGCSTPEEAKELIDCKKRRIIELKDELDDSLSANEELKKKLQVPEPFAGYKELLEKLRSKEDVEKFEWVVNHFCGGQASANGWMVTAKLWRRNYETLSKLVGFSSVEEIQDYLTNEAECDTLQEAILKLIKENKYACDERKDMKKKLEECEKDYISARDKVEALDKEIGVYSRALKDWKEGTGCPSPSAAKTLIENGPTHIIYLNDPIGVIAKWEKVTGYDRPEDFLKWKANIEGIVEAWKDRTGCKYPGEAGELLEKWKLMTKCETPEAAATWISSYESACERGNRLSVMVEKLKEEIKELRADYSHLLLTTGFESEGEIEDALDKCDHSSLRKALVDYEFDYEALLKLTGYKSERDIRDALRGEKYPYQTMLDLINSLRRTAKWNL